MNRSPIWEERSRMLRKRARNCHADVVFYGDSLIHYWEKEGQDAWNRYLRPLNAEAFGMENDCTGDLTERLEKGELELAQDPRLCFLLIGTNNTTADWGKEPVENTLSSIRHVAEMILNKFPMTRLYIEELFPRGRALKNAVRSKGERINAAMERWELPRTTILNDGQLMLDKDSRIRPEYTTDYIHLSPSGYEGWAQRLTVFIRDELTKA